MSDASTASSKTPVYLLSIDGGGIRGLSALMLLEHLMENANHYRQQDHLDHLEPWQLFDMMGGTSTGGLIAVMLGRLRMSISDCKKAYIALSEQAFTKKNLITRGVEKLRLGPKFETEPLEKAIKEIIGSSWQTSLMKEDEPDCKVFVVTHKRAVNQPVLMRSYRNHRYYDSIYGEVKIWEACRATSAALTYFEEITIRGRTYSDGGLMANNPVNQVHSEASVMFPGRQQVMISLGTGIGEPAKFDPQLLTIATDLANLATQTERTADEFYRREDDKDAREGRYFRFNVPGLGDIPMDEAAEVGKIEDLTESHLHNPEVSRKAIDCAEELSRAHLPIDKHSSVSATNNLSHNSGFEEGWVTVTYKRKIVKAVSEKEKSSGPVRREARPRKEGLIPRESKNASARFSKAWRITDIEVGALRNVIRQGGLCPAPNVRFHHAPFGPDRQTVVVEFFRRPAWTSYVPRPRVGDTSYAMTSEDITAVFDIQAWRCTSTPKVDNNFAGLTPLGASSYDLSTFDQAIRSDENDVAIRWATELRTLLDDDPDCLRTIQFDVVILTPPNKHPFDFWMNGRDMWVADYLVNEGFDATRISIYGNSSDQSRQDRLKDLTEQLASLKERSKLGSEHTIILVDFQIPANDSLALEIYKQYLSGSKNLTPLGALGVLLVSNSRSGLKLPRGKPGLQRMKLFTLFEKFPGNNIRELFSTNAHGPYKKLVDGIWKMEHELFITQSPPQPLRHNKLTENPDMAIVVFDELIDGIRRSKALNPPNRRKNGLEQNPEFFGLRENLDFRKWLESESHHHDLRIVGGQRWKLRDFCSWFFDEVKREDPLTYNVIHVDCRSLFSQYERYTRSWSGSILSGPLLLGIFRLIADQDQTSVASAIVELIRGIEHRSGIPIYDNPDSTEAPFKSLVKAIETLGSNLVDIMAEVLRSSANPTAPKLMIIMSGLDEFKRGPELGRVFYSVRKLHNSMSPGRSKILFTHEKRQDLDGLLGEIACISDLERKECLASLHNEQLSTLRPIEPRHEKTLGWIWKDKQYSGWKQAKESALLLVLGKPACGKSVLSKYINDSTEPNGSPRGDGPRHNTVVPFYFRGDPRLGDRHTMLQAILHDILDQSPLFFPYFQEQYKKMLKSGGFDDSRSITWPQEVLEGILEKLKGHRLSHTIYILVDGLDESAEPLDCAKLLGDLCPTNAASNDGLRIKLLVTMRPNKPAEYHLTGTSFNEGVIYALTLQERNRKDIEEYTRAFLTVSVARTIGWRSSVVESCIKTVATKSQGIFLWAKLAKSLINEYCEANLASSKKDFEAFLDGIPKEIEDLYSRLFADLVKRLRSREDGEVAKLSRMLQIAAQAKRELLLGEFCDAWTLPPLEDDGELPQKLDRPGNLRSFIPQITANFLEVHDSNGSVGLLHPTAKDFLEKQEDPAGGGRLLGGRKDSNISTMSGACIQYMKYATKQFCQPSSGDRRARMQNFTNTINDLPFLVYVIEHAESHISEDPQEAVDRFTDSCKEMGKSALNNLLRKWIHQRLQRLQGLHLWNRVTQLMSFSGTSTEQGFGDSVLHWAASEGLTTAAKVALKAGADPRSKSDRDLHKTGEDALCLAIMSAAGSQADRRQASVAIAQVLLDHKADVDAATVIGGTPLHYAGKFMNTGILDMLLQKRADVDAKDSRNMTPLHRAVIGLKGGVEDSEPEILDARGRVKRDASLECVKKLVMAKASLHVGDHRGQKPIHWAAGQMGREDILAYLIKAAAHEFSRGRKGANYQGQPSAQDEARAADEKCLEFSATPLFWASSHDYVKSVEILIGKGASIDYIDNLKRSALGLAARWGSAKALKVLIQGASRLGSAKVKTLLNQQECSGRTALIWASRMGHLQCVKLLVAAGADVDLAEVMEHDQWATPLSWAVSQGHLEIVEHLLDNDANMLDAGSRPLVCLAAATGDIRVIDTLYYWAEKIQVELVLDEADKLGRTAFMAASSKGHINMAKYLYELDAKVDHQDNENNTALLLAAGWGHLDMVKWLVDDIQLDIDHANILGDTALHRAARWQKTWVVDYLCKIGADADARNEFGEKYSDLLEGGRSFMDRVRDYIG